MSMSSSDIARPNSPKPSEKLVVVTPMNKDKSVRFIEPVTSSSNILKQTNSLKTKDSNKPLLTSTGVKPTTSSSGSKPSGNTKNNRITRPPNQGRSREVPKLIIEAKNQEKQSLEAVARPSPGKTYSSSSNSFGVVPIASLTLSLFHDDPYMKVLQAFYAKESPIPPPTIVPPSSMFNPQEFFLPEGLLSPKKHNRSSSSTSTLPQEFEMGESFRKTSLERYEEQIEEILNHLDELSLNRIEHIEDKIEGLGNGWVIIQQDFDNLEAELQQARA
ncbi:hypothetical protein Tco_0378674 [Tanacetum coccineum]